MTIAPDSRPRRCAHASAELRDLGDELLAYDRERRRVHVLNATAREIHLLCDGSRTLAEIADDLTRRYGVERDTALEDCSATVSRLADLGLVEV